jgi:hypothetical protein
VLGPLLALLPPGVLGVLAWAALRASDDRWSGVFGLFGGVIAAPGLLVAGAPFGDDSTYRLAVVASAPLWLLAGFAASRRSTRSPMATWSDFWREYTWLALGVAMGAVGAVVVASAVLGESLF